MGQPRDLSKLLVYKLVKQGRKGAPLVRQFCVQSPRLNAYKLGGSILLGLPSSLLVPGQCTTPGSRERDYVDSAQRPSLERPILPSQPPPPPLSRPRASHPIEIPTRSFPDAENLALGWGVLVMRKARQVGICQYTHGIIYLVVDYRWGDYRWGREERPWERGCTSLGKFSEHFFCNDI